MGGRGRMENRFSGNEKKGRKNGKNGENFESEDKTG